MAVEDWITQEEAAKKLHIALDTMRRWVRAGYFRKVKVGKRNLIEVKSIEEFLISRSESPRTVPPVVAAPVPEGKKKKPLKN